MDLDKLAEELDGYSAADCVALLREAALTAMRRSIDAADVTTADVEAARETVRPSLDPVQVEALQGVQRRPVTIGRPARKHCRAGARGCHLLGLLRRSVRFGEVREPGQ